MIGSNINSGLATPKVKAIPTAPQTNQPPSCGKDLPPVEYNDSWIGKILTKFLATKIAEIAGREPVVTGGEGAKNKEFSMLVDAAFLINQRPGKQAQEMTKRLLKESLPSWFPGTFRAFLECFPTWFDARHAAVSTLLLTNWLVGPAKSETSPPPLPWTQRAACGLSSTSFQGASGSRALLPLAKGWQAGLMTLPVRFFASICLCRRPQASSCSGPVPFLTPAYHPAVVDTPEELLDSEESLGRGKGWGNEPTGWVPGFAIGGPWRKERGAGQGVLIERCRVLEASGCLSVCVNVCKGPTQQFFTETVGLPLTMVPDFEKTSCHLYFGATPPPLTEDPATQFPCLTQCPVAGAGRAECDTPERCKKLASA